MVDPAIIGGLLTNLAPLIGNEISLVSSFKKDVEKISSILSLLHAVLEDADRKIKLEEMDKQTEDWLRKLKDVAYEVRDIMDECKFEDLRLEVKKHNASSSTWIQVTNCITHPFCITRTRLNIGHKIKDILEKLDQISSERNKLHSCETSRESKSTCWRETKSKPSEKVYGRDKEKENIIDILVHTSPDGIEKLSVLPIHGLGGLGKTTLAQLIFDDEKITKCFDVKYWVCVSEEFDIKLVIKAIIGTTNENSLEILQNQIQDKLKGKKYLIVLDDVWNENVQKWNKLRSILDCGSNGSFILTTTRKRNVAEIMKRGVQYFELLSLSNDDCWQLFEERAFMYGTPKTTNFIGIGKEIVKKCKGVPLVVKTLGGQLGFKNDEKEWCRIKDSDMWKLSQNGQNEEYDILSILRLSYYDLPYYLRRCFAFCAIFPKDTKILKERLIQLWMAHDLIPTNENQEVEDVGNQIWNDLCWRSFFQDEKEKIDYLEEVQRTCKMHDFMHDVAQSIMKDQCCSSSEDFRQGIRHVMVTHELQNIPTIHLKKIRSLQSIIFHPHAPPGTFSIEIYGPGTFSTEIFRVLKKLPSLRVFEACHRIQGQDLHYVGCLKHLRYLSLSYCMVKTLPNSVCDLLNLRTLNLNECSILESLPKKMKDLINLRHLHLRECNKLKYMPKGIGRLRHLKTLSLFVINKESDGELNELKELDIGGYMEIKNLEKVSDACIAKGRISMSQKSRINQLVLHWNDSRPFPDDDEMKSRDEKIGEALEVSCTSLKILRMEGYKGVNIPKWMGESSASLTILRLDNLDNVEYIFTMKNKNLSDFDNDMDGTVYTLFPLLKELKVRRMKNLREILSPPIPIPIPTGESTASLTILRLSNLKNVRQTFPLLQEQEKEFTIDQSTRNLREIVSSPIPTTGAFPNLREIHIDTCPELRALPPHLKSLKNVTVKGECTDELLYSISDLSGQLTRLRLGNVNERSVLFPCASTSSNEMNGTTVVTLFPLLEELVIQDMKNLRELVSLPIPITATTGGAFPSLRNIFIYQCPKIGVLPSHLKSLKDVWVEGECADELLYSISNLSALTDLTLDCMYERSVLFGGGNYYYKADEDMITSSSSSTLAADNINEAQGGSAASTFQSLKDLYISRCSKLSCLFDEEGCDKLARGGGCIRNLNSLSILKCPELMISLEQWRNLTRSRSLQRLYIRECPKLVPSKVEEADEVLQLLRSLRERHGSENIRVDILDNEDERIKDDERRRRRSIFLCN